MKKRIFMLALVVGVMLSVCGSAWAGTYNYYTIADFNLNDLYDAKADTTVTVTFDIIVNAYKTQPSEVTVYKNANLLKWKVGGADMTTESEYFKVTGVKITNNGVEGKNATNTSEYLLIPITYDDSNGTVLDPATYNVTIEVTGTLKKTNGEVKVTASLYKIGDGTAAVTAETQSQATTKATSEESKDTITISEEWDYAGDTANPDGAWDGKDPTFTSDPGDNQYAKGKAKLTTKRIDDFEAGKAKSVKVEFTGPVTEIDVYIAAKDALKLWPDDETVKGLDKKEGKIQLTKENIKKYNIPFRITNSDFSRNEDKLNGVDPKEDKDGAKRDKETAKNMTSTLTLAFNGGYFSYKGFPLTFSVTNNEMKKPAAKALKLNVKPYDKTPQWWYPDTRHNTTKTDTLSNIPNGALTLDKNQLAGNPTFTILDEKNKEIKGAKVTSKDESGTVTYTLSGLTSGQTATVKVTYDYKWDEDYKHVLDKKDKPEVAVAATEEGTDLATATPHVFYISGDYGPFNITEKGSSKNEAVTVTVVPPVYNYRGEINKDNSGNDLKDPSGYVAFSGTLALDEKKKEIKVPVTLTLLNQTVKKKAAAKVTVFGKIPPYFDTKKYPVSDDLECGVVTTKTVEAGKVPSVKVKAGGSKTISYYVTDSDLEQLKAVGLSFDNKKGAVVEYPKGKKDTKPTKDEEGNFAPIGLSIYATNGLNGVEDPSVFASVGITGAKPKISTKEVKFSKTEHVEGKYKLIEVTLKNSANADVKFSPATDSDASALEELGLELINGSEIEELVSTDTKIVSGTTTVDTAKPYKIITKKDDGSVKAELKEGTSGYTLGDDSKITIAESITETVYLRQGEEAQSGLAKYKNKAAIRVVTPDSMKDGVSKKQISITANNVGASATGKVKVTIEALPEETEENGALPGSNKAASEAAGSSSATKTSGTAGLTYNGAAPDADAEAESEAAEGTVTFGAPRTVADLTADQQAFLAEKGYTVVAVLPEITADVSDQYKLENIELDEDAPEGATLIWIAFPKNAPASEDDEIVDFYDEAGTPVEGVPASHKIIAVPWLREAVTYEPVIAIEAK